MTRTNLIALAALIGPGIGPHALVDARNIFAGPPPHANGRGRAASPAVLKGKGLLRASISNINADKLLPCKNPNSSCHVTVVDGDEELDVELEPHSVRAQGYKLLAQQEGGELSEVDPGPDTTFRGHNIAGDPGSAVAASVTAAGVLMEIFKSDGVRIVVEPAGDAAEVEGDHVVYHAEDVEPTPDKLCGAMALERRSLEEDEVGGDLHLHPLHDHGAGDHHHHHPHLRHLHEKPQRETTERRLAASFEMAEVAFDADYEYYLDWKGTSQDVNVQVNNVEARIHSIINTINLQYESEVGITHQITTIIVRTTSNDPYTSTDALTLLNQFRDEWNANQAGIQRDVAHLMTGKTINGGTIGIAWVGVICILSYGYGLSESDFSNNFAAATDLTAHELGHNWNAGHCDCTSYTMNPYITNANTFNPVGTRSAITSHRDSRSCLTTVDCTEDSHCTATGESCDVDTNDCVQSETSPPSKSPSKSPSASPSSPPSSGPSKAPTSGPTASPSVSPSASPSQSPSKSPTASPEGSASSPSKSPTAGPTASPSVGPSSSPSKEPTVSPTHNPTASPSKNPDASPEVAGPVCGDGTCDAGEDCTCSDCGCPSGFSCDEGTCCGSAGASCDSDSDCCSNKCRGSEKNGKTCKG